MLKLFKRPASKSRSVVGEFENYFGQNLALGVTGGGKTTAMANEEIAFLSHPSKPGAVHTCVKESAADEGVAYATMAVRGDDVIVMEEGSGFRFDVMDWELSRPGGSGETAAHLFDYFSSILTQNSGQGEDNKMWDQYRIMTLRHSIDLCRCAGKKPSVQACFWVIGLRGDGASLICSLPSWTYQPRPVRKNGCGCLRDIDEPSG